MNRRLLILSASAGSGHMRAAEAVEVAAREMLPEWYIENHDVLTLTNALFRRMYAESYFDLVSGAPHLLGMLYDWLDRPKKTTKDVGERFRRMVQKVNLLKFEKLVREGNWDLIISTHFLPVELISQLRLDGKIDTPQVTVCTDFATHRLWVNEPCERYFCATDEGAAYLEFFGVPPQCVEVTGIPIHPSFSRPVDRAAVLAKHGLTSERKIVLQMCGGFGIGPVEEIYRSLLSTKEPIQLMVVCGKNDELKQRLDAVERVDRHRVQILGYTQEMHELMTVADILVSKPGGLTTSEALVCGLPMIIANPIPGQETRNSDYLLENGAAVKIDHPSLLPLKLGKILEDARRLEEMRAATRKLAKPRAAFDVVERSLPIVR